MKRILFVTLFFMFGSMPAQADEYPSDETVRFVLNCMGDLGGQNDENLYTCVCRYDAIRDAMVFTEYEEGRTYERNKAMAGEKGGFFRDNKRGEGFYKTLVKVREEANKNCPVVRKVEFKRAEK